MVVVVVAWLVSLFIAIFAVPRLVAPKAREAWTTWLMSEAADPYMDRLAERVTARLPDFPDIPTVAQVSEAVMEAMEPRLSGFEERINQPVQLDLLPIVALVEDRLTPKFTDVQEKVRAFIDGKIGWARQVKQGMGEAVAERVGEAAAEAAGLDSTESEIMGELEGMLADAEWVKAHRAAAFGLRILRKEIGKGGGGPVTLTKSRSKPGW